MMTELAIKIEHTALNERLDVYAVQLQEHKLGPSTNRPIFLNYATVMANRPNGDGVVAYWLQSSNMYQVWQISQITGPGKSKH